MGKVKQFNGFAVQQKVLLRKDTDRTLPLFIEEFDPTDMLICYGYCVTCYFPNREVPQEILAAFRGKLRDVGMDVYPQDYNWYYKSAEHLPMINGISFSVGTIEAIEDFIATSGVNPHLGDVIRAAKEPALGVGAVELNTMGSSPIVATILTGDKTSDTTDISDD